MHEIVFKCLNDAQVKLKAASALVCLLCMHPHALDGSQQSRKYRQDMHS